jgi:multidrug efflux pump subunit AcrA (membrane-fusion protein)
MARFLNLGSAPAGKLISCLLLTSLIAGCSSSRSETRGGNANRNAEDQAPVVTITTTKAESRDMPAYIQATGTLVADETSSVAPKVAGKVVNVGVNVGQFISQGALIAKIDDRNAKLDLAQAQAGVKQAQAAVRQAEARIGLGPNGTFNASAVPEVRAANANYEQSLAELKQAEANEKRYRELVETGDVSLVTYEQFRTSRDTARAKANNFKEQLDAAANNARQNNQAIKSAEANVEAAQAQVRTAEQAVADTVVRAPFAGYVSERQVAVGEFVSTASVLATLLRTNPIKIQIQVAEADVPAVTLGRGVSVEVQAYRDRRFGGTVTSVNPAVDIASRSAVVEASIENGDNALRAGMFGSARITREGGTIGVFVPKSAVYNDQATQSFRAFVIVDGVAKLRVLQLGIEEGDSYQIVSGLQGDEIVATSNLNELYEGAKVAT